MARCRICHQQKEVTCLCGYCKDCIKEKGHRACYLIAEKRYYCMDCGSNDYPNHEEYCTMGDTGWKVKKDDQYH